MIKNIIKKFSTLSRQKRAVSFITHFHLTQNTKILDLGSENGKNIFNVIKKTSILPQNVYIADINIKLIEEGNRLFDFQPVLISESGKIPFPDNYFDIVYSSSVIEHVTIPKQEVWSLKSSKHFKQKAFERQKEFANEIRRLGKSYFVQNPNKFFLIESHTWLPFVSWFPRAFLIKFLRISNKIWIKKTSPDWNLITKSQMKSLFPTAIILYEKILGLNKSIIAIKNDNDLTDSLTCEV